MLNNFIYSKTKDLFLEQLEAGHVLDEAVAFIEDTTEIWNHGTYFDGTNVREYAFPKTGGLITGVSSYPLQLKSSSDIYSTIRFITNNNDYITFGFKNSDNPQLFFTNKNDWSSEYFLYHSGNFNPSDYLPLTGGTMNTSAGITFKSKDELGGGWAVDCIKMTGMTESNVYSRLGYYGTDNYLLYTYIGSDNYSGKNLRIYADKVSFGENTILHAGNFADLIGDTYLKTDGSKRMTSGISFVANAIDYNNAGNGIRMLFQSSANAPETWMRSLSVFEGSSGFQIGVQVLDSKERLFYRQTLVDNAWGDWKTIAFTDSDITGNATTATKLKDSVTLWGNTFDGTQGLNGNITLNNNTRIGFNYGDTVYNAISFNTVGTLAIGYDGATFRGLATHIYGGNIRFYTAAANGTPAVAMTITDSGNVTIGSSAYTSDDTTKLFVNGLTRVKGLGTYTLGSIPTAGLILNAYNNSFGMTQLVENSGQGFIQVGRYDGTAIAYALNLNPLGGNVNIASADATTNVLGSLVVEKSLSTRESIVSEGGLVTIGKSDGTSNGNLLFNRKSINYIWAYNEGGYFAIGVKDKGEVSGINASLIINNNQVFGGYRNNEVSLGTSGYRWSNVYSLLGTFEQIELDSILKSTIPNGGTYARWRILHTDLGLYIQSATNDGTSEQGKINLTGVNNATLTNFNVSSTVSKFSGRVLIGGAVDDGSSALQIHGDISMNGTSLTNKLSELEQRLTALEG